ncbi:MAG TPA: hypothetical protein DEV93_10540 [Chloroflexi bacterium]|jgi:crotonobetainyl-CoA:carnitine CoA-transferase CaiB-like acyl-CoA transferase|nr:hypothetical protein [Chloroflexota bacterium]
MSLPLAGVKVLEISQMLAGPGGARYLADYGADVIKVEPPGGEPGRASGNSSSGISKSFLVVNRNKRGISIDLKSKAGLQICQKLVRWSDVLIIGMRPRAAGALQLNYQAVAEVNPSLVYVTLSGWGSEGPDAGAKAYDLLIQARSGIAGARHTPDGTPMTCPVRVADDVAPIMLAFAISMALFQRSTTGKGSQLDVSLLASAVAVQTSSLVRLEKDPELPAAGAVDIAVHSPFRCQDGGYMMLAVTRDQDWKSLCACLGLSHLADDPRYDTQLKRTRSRELYKYLGDAFATRPAKEWQVILRAHDVPAERVASREDIFSDPQAIHSRAVTAWDDPLGGKVEGAGFPITIEGEQPQVKRPAPRLGEHNAEILRELGFSPADMELPESGPN